MSNHVILVDDDSFYAEILGDLLTMQGYTPRHYPSGPDCLKALESGADTQPVDAFILDVVMPGMDGYELCSQLRKNPKYEKTAILFVSSKASLDDRMRGYEAGGNDYIGKPAQPDELKAKLKQAVDASRQKVTSDAHPESEAPAAPGRFDFSPLSTFLNACHEAASAEAIGQVLGQGFLDQGLQVSYLMRSDTQSLFSSNDGRKSPIERELLELAPQNQLLIEFNNRLIINAPVVSVLVRRLPGMSAGDMAAFKDFLALLVRQADQRLSVLRHGDVRTLEKDACRDVIADIRQAIVPKTPGGSGKGGC
jgi:DNA-binding response OmpR family regulator